MAAAMESWLKGFQYTTLTFCTRGFARPCEGRRGGQACVARLIQAAYTAILTYHGVVRGWWWQGERPRSNGSWRNEGRRSEASFILTLAFGGYPQAMTKSHQMYGT